MVCREKIARRKRANTRFTISPFIRNAKIQEKYFRSKIPIFALCTEFETHSNPFAMIYRLIPLTAMLLLLFTFSDIKAQLTRPVQMPPDFKVDTRIDNMGYWRQCAAWGLVPVQPYTVVPPARFTGTKILLRGVRVVDSPDICTTNEPSNSTQSENSIVINPNNEAVLLNSNNSTPQPSNGSVKGADALKSLDSGETWSGTVEGAGGPNSGDPAAVIDLNGRWFVGYIDNGNGQSVSWSDDNGATWTVKKVANGSFSNLLDKNHLWADVSPVSPYKNNLYNGWMSNNNIFVSRSVTHGTEWSSPVNISAATAAGSHNQGINFKCGPDGEVYAAWSVYDNWPGDEKAIGFARSFNGGETWEPAIRAINNTKGIRTSGVSQNMRVNSFPSMAVDISNSPYRGTIYVVWANIGVPGVNVGPGSSIYMIKSTDKGVTWSAPKRVNTDSTAGKHHYFPWIACDQATGYLSIVFYDNRNCAANEAEAWMAYSTNGGETFEDLKVSDVTFTPSPIPMMASKYMGDYLAIDSYGGKAFPCWTDTRSGHCLTYISPIDILIPSSSIQNIAQNLNDTTYGNSNGLMDYGETSLIGLEMKNTGNATAEGVTVELLCDHPHITILDPIETYGDFEPEQVKYIHDGYRFKVNDSIANNESVVFTVKATDQKDSITYSTFQLIAHAPDVTLLGMTISDPEPGGNNNGRLDPGETAMVIIETKNLGIWDAEQVVSYLNSQSGYLTIGNPSYAIGTLAAGQSVPVAFTVNVHPSAPVGSYATLHNQAVSKFRVTDKLFNVRIGLIVEDWETGDFSKFPWQFTKQSNPWTIDQVIRYEKLFSARTDDIGDSDTTGIFLTYHAAIDDSISFYRRVSTQPIKDVLKFYIDDAMVGLWSNFTDTAFRRSAYPVLAGTHTFRWVYEKNSALSQGDDACHIDFIVFPPEYKPSVNAGGDAEICSGDSYQLHGMAYSYDSVRWSTQGDGLFSETGILNPLYNPGSQDVSNGSVILTLTIFAKNNTTIHNSMTLTIAPPVSADAGPDSELCKGGVFNTSASALNFESVEWSTSGDGFFDQPGILHTGYYPGSGDLLAGTVTLTLKATGNASCPDAIDALSITLKDSPVIELGRDTVLCANASIVLDATTAQAATYLWSPSGKTTPVITVDSVGIGLSNRMITLAATGANGCLSLDSVRIGFRICGGIEEWNSVIAKVYPNPTKGLAELEITLPGTRMVNLAVRNAAGQTVFYKHGITVQGSLRYPIDLSGQPSGQYLIILSDDQGAITRKVTLRK